MRKRRIFYFLAAMVLIGVVLNSCKKDTQSPIEQLFTGGQWQLASVVATYWTGNTVDSTVTLNSDTVCHMQQYFTFFTNNTCTYTNYDCLTQSPPAAAWSLASNQVYLQANVMCKDTTAKGSSTPFADAEIVNLGQFSLVLEIGDIQPSYSLTQKRITTQYGFVRQKLNGVD
jgi:hypothetical protein